MQQCNPTSINFNIFVKEDRLGRVFPSNKMSFIKRSKFGRSDPVVFLVHGFTRNSNEPGVVAIREAFLSLPHRVNVFTVDWSSCSSGGTVYLTPASNTRVVGRVLANFVNYLTTDIGVKLEDIKFIGHSLGAHALGFAGKSFKAMFNKTLKSITGIDPAGPGFCNCDPKSRLSHTDADCVEVLHTTESFGCSCAMGTVDYYVNGGIVQPGCNDSIVPTWTRPYCSHDFGTYFLANIIKMRSNDCNAQFCPSRVNCNETADPLQQIGTDTTCMRSGIFYLRTNPIGSEKMCKGTSGAIKCDCRITEHCCYEYPMHIPCV